MRLRRIAVVLIVTGLASGAVATPPEPGASAGTPAAVLVTCSGHVTVVRADGKSMPGSFGMQLHAGDQVKTGADASAEVMLSDGTWLQVGAGSGMQIKSRPGAAAGANAGTTTGKDASGKAGKPAGGEAMSGKGAGTEGVAYGEKSFEVVQNFIKLKDASGTSSLTALRGDNKGELVAVSPGQTRIRTDRPTFRWEIADPSAELKLTVYDETGVYWQRDVKGTTSLPYPSDAPALAPGTTWSWTVETSDPLVVPPLRSQAIYFEVLSREEAEMLDEALAAIDSQKKPGKSTYHLMRASLFFDQGLLEDAIDETLTALASDPDNDSLHAILARLYAESGHAREAYEKSVRAN